MYFALLHTPLQAFPVTCVCVCLADFQSLTLVLAVCSQGYDNTESSVRKASVFCLVAIYSVIGEDLKPHLAQLTGSKVLAAMYLKSSRTHTQTCPCSQKTRPLLVFHVLDLTSGFN